MTWPDVVPAWLTLPLYAIVPAVIACLLHAAFRRWIPPEQLIEHHDVAGFLVSVVGVLYSVVLGFLVATVWTSFQTAQQTADIEAGYVADALAFTSALPPQHRASVQKPLARYAVEVHDVEWKTLAHGREDPRAHALLVEAVAAMLAMPPPHTADLAAALEAESNRDSLIFHLRNIGDERRLRISQARSQIPASMYEALLLGAAIVVAFAFLFGVTPVRLQMTMTALLVASIGLFLGLVIELSTPYAGPIRVSSDAWAYIIHHNIAALSR